MRWVRLKAIAIAGCTLFSLAMASEVTYQVVRLRGEGIPKEPGERLYFQPLGDFPASVVAELKEHFEERFPPTRGLRITVLPGRSLPPEVADPRGTLVSEELLTLIRRQNSLVAADPRAVIIGLTTRDMYSREEGTVWAWRQYRYGVVSSAMFGPTLLGNTEAATVARSRLRKMVAKNIAILYYLKLHDNKPRSLLYAGLRSVAQIDRAIETF